MYCSNSKYCYEPAGHVVLTIIRDAKLRSLVMKGPSYVTRYGKRDHSFPKTIITFFTSRGS